LVGSTTTRLQRQAANQKKSALKAVLANLKQLVGVGDLAIKDSPAICLSIRIIQDRGKNKTYFKPPTSFSVISAVQPMIV